MGKLSTSWQEPATGLYVDTWRVLVGMKALHNVVGHRQTDLQLEHPDLAPYDYHQIAVALRRAGDGDGAEWLENLGEEAQLFHDVA